VSALHRLQAAGLVVYAAVFVLLLAYGRPGLGITQGFYLAIILVAFAGGPLTGAAAGALAAVLLVTATLLKTSWAWASLPRTPIEIRVSLYVVTGVAVGYFARRGRRMLADSLHVLDDVLRLARRDLETGALNPHGLEAAIERRTAGGWPFALLVGDLSTAFEAVSDALVRKLTTLISETVAEGEVARTGPSQFAVVTPCLTLSDAREIAAALERALDAAGCRGSFGWACHPQEGGDALSLYRSASERLYARRIVRGEWRPTAATAELVAELGRGVA